jgi:hypothetical protein
MAIGLFDLIKYLGYIPQLAGTIMATVAFVEGIKVGDPGPEKKLAVLDALKLNWNTISVNFTSKVITFEQLVPLISLLIDLAVTIYNMFWKKLEPPPPLPPLSAPRV